MVDRDELRRIAVDAAVVTAASSAIKDRWETTVPDEIGRHFAAFGPRQVLELLDAIARVEAQLDEWDQLSKGETPTTARIRAAINGRNHG